MKARLVLTVGLAMLTAPAWAAEGRTTESGQAQSRLVITHLGVVVNDVAAAASGYASLVGVDPPAVQTSDPGHGAGLAKTALVHLSNITIEVIEPSVDANDPLRLFLEARGPGVHHIGLHDGSGERRSVTDLTDRLGVVFEYGPSGSSPAQVTQPSLALPTCVTHIGIVVRDMAGARLDLAELVGIEPTPVNQFQEVRGPAEYTAFRFDNVSIELLQQVGTTGHYADFVRTLGPRAHHLGLHLRGRNDSLPMPDQIEWLERHRGVMAVNAGGFAYVDFRPRLGLLIEALPMTASDRVYPHPHPTP